MRLFWLEWLLRTRRAEKAAAALKDEQGDLRPYAKALAAVLAAAKDGAPPLACLLPAGPAERT